MKQIWTHIKRIEWHSPIVFFLTLFKMVLDYESGDEILMSNHSNVVYYFSVVLFIMLYFR